MLNSISIVEKQEPESVDFEELRSKRILATEKLAEGIYLFSKDVEKLEELIRSRLELNKQ